MPAQVISCTQAKELTTIIHHSAGELPNDDACGDGNVHRVLGAELLDFEASVAGIDHLLMHALHLIAQDNGVCF